MRRRAFLGLLLAALAAEIPATAQVVSQPVARAPAYILYASPTTRRLLENDAVDVKARVNTWRDLVRSRGAAFFIANHPVQLAQMPRATALIVPSAIALNDEERRVIQGRIDAGESLLATWMPGTVNASGAAVKSGFIENAFKVGTRPAPNDERGFLITAGDTPLTHAFPAGTRLWVGRDTRFATPLLATPGAGYLSDWSRAPDDSGLLYFISVGESRRVLLGWPETVWNGHPAEFGRVANLALDYVEGRPAAYMRSWPWPYRGALTIGVDALWRFENVPRLAELLTRHGVRGSFHFLPESADAQKALIREVAAAHSVGGFGDVAKPFAGQPEAEQRARVQRMLAGFRSALGPDFVVSGMRAPQGATDAATEKAAEMLDYVVDAGRIDSAMPVLPASGKPVLLSASVNLDSNASRDAIEKGLAIARMRAELGGYVFVGVDNAGFNRGSPMEAELGKFIASTWGQAKDIWPASGAEVASWWRQRDGLHVSGNWDAREAALDLDIKVREPLTFPAAIGLVPPPGRTTVRLDANIPGTIQGQRDAAGNPVLVLNALPPGEHRVRLRFLP